MTSENPNNPANQENIKFNKLYKLFKLERPCPERGEWVSTAFFYLSILLFIIGFNFTDTPPAGNWYQQFMPFLNNRPISDITFIDSLNGFAVTGDDSVGDTNYVLKTTNKGDSWNIIFTVFRDLSRVKFINMNTGFVCGGYNDTRGYLIKTTDAGVNWTVINTPFGMRFDDMALFEEDTIWLADKNNILGGVRRTVNGGANWQLLASFGGSNPNKIYMYDRNIGFIGESFSLKKTTDGGFNWTLIPGETGFRDMHFVDSLIGWKVNSPASDTNVRKTTNGGLIWLKQQLPAGTNISFGMGRFSIVNIDTIWGVGGVLQFPNLQSRGMIYRTTNGGINWLFQIPDTSFNIYSYGHIQFLNKNTGWVYAVNRGIHTTNGGDTNFILPVNQISTEVAVEFKLFQNYPNPFNPKTIIRFQIIRLSDVKLNIYDITGKEIITLVNEKKSAGTYEVDFSGSGYSSGVYFYSLIADGKLIDTKKMVLLK